MPQMINPWFVSIWNDSLNIPVQKSNLLVNLAVLYISESLKRTDSYLCKSERSMNNLPLFSVLCELLSARQGELRLKLRLTLSCRQIT